MSQGPRLSTHDEQQLMSYLWAPEIKDNPLAFVMFAFPWGKKGTPLENFKGPRAWQKEELLNIAIHIQQNKIRGINGQPYVMYKSATASGRGVGKSALVSWLALWFMSTRLGSTTIVSANTETQLKTRTWAEVGKWHTLAINSHWFDKATMSLKPVPWFFEAVKKSMSIDEGYYYAAAQLWSEENPDSFAGVHNPLGMLLVFDESSGIPAPIWKVSEGFFTEPTPDRYWFNFSNPRRNTGEFFECFFRHRAYWRRRNLDSRKVEGTDKTILQEIVDKYGEDSDEARVEVKGEFPRQGDKQFISRDIVVQAQERELNYDAGAALIMGVDPARYGDDSTVIRFRAGRDAKSIPPVEMKGADNMAVANKCAELIRQYDPEAVCIDAGNGTGIIDRLRELGYKVHEVWFGSKPVGLEWANRRTELWDEMREWLKGGSIDASEDLQDDLCSPIYRFMGGSDKIMLETKEELKKRGFASPDHGDALACTFAVKAARRDSRSLGRKRSQRARGIDYDVLS